MGSFLDARIGCVHVTSRQTDRAPGRVLLVDHQTVLEVVRVETVQAHAVSIVVEDESLLTNLADSVGILLEVLTSVIGLDVARAGLLILGQSESWDTLGALGFVREAGTVRDAIGKLTGASFQVVVDLALLTGINLVQSAVFGGDLQTRVGLVGILDSLVTWVALQATYCGLVLHQTLGAEPLSETGVQESLSAHFYWGFGELIAGDTFRTLVAGRVVRAVYDRVDRDAVGTLQVGVRTTRVAVVVLVVGLAVVDRLRVFETS